jgi:soluble lytic murein transglycosylase-like protein
LTQPPIQGLLMLKRKMNTRALERYVARRVSRSASARLLTIARDALAIVGMVAIGLALSKVSLTVPLVSPQVSPLIIDRDALVTKEIAPTVPRYGAQLSVTLQDPNPNFDVLANYIARNYRIAREVAREVVNTSFDAAKGHAVDPLLVLAVMAIESRFNPIAESDMGAKGLMQVIPKFHPEKFELYGGEDMALDPRTNIRVGAQILQEYIARAGGTAAGLQWYNGAAHDVTRQYAEKVLGEYDRLASLVGRRPAVRGPSA